MIVPLMPEGVEHSDTPRRTSSALTVIVPLMPEGVEISGRNSGPTLTNTQSNSATRFTTNATSHWKIVASASMEYQKPLLSWAAVSTNGSAALTHGGITWVGEIWEVHRMVLPSHGHWAAAVQTGWSP